MPVYEYRCNSGCENYEVWRSIDERQKETNCPSCSSEGVRIFTPIMSLNGKFRLKQEQSGPRLIRKETKEVVGKQRLKESGARPWMLNRGC